jgi:hypothetical protein
VVECTGLENRRAERHREFESHRFRHKLNDRSVTGASHCKVSTVWRVWVGFAPCSRGRVGFIGVPGMGQID